MSSRGRGRGHGRGRGRGRPRRGGGGGRGAYGRRLYGGRGRGTAAASSLAGVVGVGGGGDAADAVGRSSGEALAVAVKRKIKVEIAKEDPRPKSLRLRALGDLSGGGGGGSGGAPSASDAPGAMRPPKRFEHGLVRPTWTITDKEALLTALKRFGSKDVAALADAVPYKDIKTVRDFVAKEKRNQNYVVDLRKSDFSGHTETFVTQRAKDSAIETWIQGVEAKDRLAAAAESGKRPAAAGALASRHTAAAASHVPSTPLPADASSALPRMLDWIARFEPHPSPDDCAGVDYKQIYEALAALMVGDVPKDLSPSTSAKLIELLSRLQASLSRACLAGELAAEMDFLDSYRDLAAPPRAPTRMQMEPEGKVSPPPTSFYAISGVNPFAFPTNMLHNNVIPRKSHSPQNR